MNHFDSLDIADLEYDSEHDEMNGDPRSPHHKNQEDAYFAKVKLPTPPPQDRDKGPGGDDATQGEGKDGAADDSEASGKGKGKEKKKGNGPQTSAASESSSKAQGQGKEQEEETKVPTSGIGAALAMMPPPPPPGMDPFEEFARTISGRRAILPNKSDQLSVDYDTSGDEEELIRGSTGRRSIRGRGTMRGGRPGAGGGMAMEVHFDEYLDGEPVAVEIPHAQCTVAEFIDLAITECERGGRTLKGKNYRHYDLFLWDFDEIDTDAPAFNKTSQVMSVGESKFGLVLNKKAVAVAATSSGGLSAVSRTMSRSLDVPWMGEERRRIESTSSRSFLRISVPGPAREVHTIAIDADSTAFTLRDLFFSLNRKKQGVHFHPAYFEFFYQGQTREEPLAHTTRVLDLEDQSLVILPKRIGNNDPQRAEAFQYELVRLANEYQEWRASKMRGSKKKGRILGVDRYRITKQVVANADMFDPSMMSINTRQSTSVWRGLSDKITKQNHIPIDISCVTNARILPEEPRCCSLTYRHPRGGVRTHKYEMQSSSDCRSFVNKVTFLVALHKIRP